MYRNYLVKNKLLIVLIIIIIIQAAFYTYYGISRHYNYMTSLVDLGHADQSIWGTMHGNLFLNTDNFNKAVVGRIEPIILLFSPLYFIYPHIIWLIIVKSLAIPLTSLPIYFLSRRLFDSEQAAFFWAIACLFSPFMLSAASWDFQAVALAAPFIALAFLAVEEKRPRLIIFSCIFVLLCKEHFGLLVIGFGFLWYLKNRDYKVPSYLTFLGCTYFYLVMFIFIPAISPTGQHPMISVGVGPSSRYGWLGDSITEVIKTIISSPVEIFQRVFLEMNGWIYLFLLFLPLFFLPVVGFEFLLPGMADFLANLLSENLMPRSIFAYHSVSLMPVVLIAAIYGSVRISRLFHFLNAERQAFCVMIFTLVFGWYLFPFFELPWNKDLWKPKRVLEFSDPDYDLVLGKIDPGMSVSVQANLGAHFTQREEIYMYPNKIGEVDAVILRLESPTKFINSPNPVIGSLGHHLQMDPPDYLESINRLLTDSAYKKIFWRDPWLIFIKGEEVSGNTAEIRRKLDILSREWQPRLYKD